MHRFQSAGIVLAFIVPYIPKGIQVKGSSFCPKQTAEYENINTVFHLSNISWKQVFPTLYFAIKARAIT